MVCNIAWHQLKLSHQRPGARSLLCTFLEANTGAGASALAPSSPIGVSMGYWQMINCGMVLGFFQGDPMFKASDRKPSNVWWSRRELNDDWTWIGCLKYTAHWTSRQCRWIELLAKCIKLHWNTMFGGIFKHEHPWFLSVVGWRQGFLMCFDPYTQVT